MNHPEPNITVNVDVTNPGQFFACCGLLELADRLWPGAEGWFGHDDRSFLIAGGGTLGELIDMIVNAELVATRPSDPASSPMTLKAKVDSRTVELSGVSPIWVGAQTPTARVGMPGAF